MQLFMKRSSPKYPGRYIQLVDCTQRRGSGWGGCVCVSGCEVWVSGGAAHCPTDLDPAAHNTHNTTFYPPLVIAFTATLSFSSPRCPLDRAVSSRHSSVCLSVNQQDTRTLYTFIYLPSVPIPIANRVHLVLKVAIRVRTTREWYYEVLMYA